MEIAKLKEDISLLEGREKMLELEYKEEIKALQVVLFLYHVITCWLVL